MESVSVELSDDRGTAGHLVLSELPRQSRLDGGGALREGGAYRFAVEGLSVVAGLEPAELFDPDDASGLRGRLRPGQHVGQLLIIAHTVDGRELRGRIEVVPTKLERSTEYRQMLDDIAEHAADAVLQGFAPAQLDLAPGTAPAELLYQRFALVQARLTSPEFIAAMGLVIARPHMSWQQEPVPCPPGAGYPSGSAFSRAVTAPGPRRPWPAGRGLRSVPEQLLVARHEDTFDTAANRFVRYALERWRGIATELIDGLPAPTGREQAGPVRRGRSAAQAVIAQLDQWLAQPLLREVGPMSALPAANQVLLKRPGYREVFRTFALVETGVTLSLDGADDDVFSASQRNTATLYEFWCFLVLADALGDVCGEHQTAAAFGPASDGMSLALRAGVASPLRWDVLRSGRQLEVELYFNRTFSVLDSGTGDGSWTRAMRPDCSVRIRPTSGVPRRTERFDLDVWVHFDAKYRVEYLVDQLQVHETGEDGAAAAAEETERIGQTKREDLLKMHAYRDAIHRTAGAYVLYPGTEPVRRDRFTELLPGLGAFPLRPGPSGAVGLADLRVFLDDVLDHVSQQATRHERDRFWTATVHEPGAAAPTATAPAGFLDQPPADTDVLLGFVRGVEHQTWVQRHHLYNVRADENRAGAVALGSRVLGAPLLLLYTAGSVLGLAATGSWRAATRDELVASGYPGPGGRLYLVTSYEPIPDVPAWLSTLDVRAALPAGHTWGEPTVVTWLDLLLAADSGHRARDLP